MTENCSPASSQRYRADALPAVLISIHPRHVNNILSGKKKYEVRKTKPHVCVPFKVYIYQTLPKYGDWNDRDGRVVAEFVCDEIVEDKAGENADILTTNACLTLDELKAYGGNKVLYGWHVSDLVVYKKPVPLPNLMAKPCINAACCSFCEEAEWREDESGRKADFVGCRLEVKKAPQSWRYVVNMGPYMRGG